MKLNIYSYQCLQGGSSYEGYYVWKFYTPDLGNLYDLSNNENDFVKV